MTTPTPEPAPSTPPDPLALLKTKSYSILLLFGAIIGVPIAAVAYFFLKWVQETQQWLYDTLPKQLGFAGAPVWWPIPVLILGGLIVALAIRYLPGTGGHSPVFGFHIGGSVGSVELYGIFIASFATLASGAVLGPEMPLIALGSGFAVVILHLLRRDAPAMAVTVIGAAGSFAAISTLLGSPLVGAFLILEAAGLAGPTLPLVMLPGLLAAGVGSLIFIGLDRWTGFGTFSLSIPHIPHFTSPTGAEFLWALGIGAASAVVGTGIRRLGLLLRPMVERWRLVVTPAIGLGVALLAIAFVEGTGKSNSYVLFSGQSAVTPLIQHASSFTVGALTLLIVCKGIAYGGCLSGFRGGPTFPGMFIGAAGGIALSHLAGLPMIAGAAMGMGAMTTVMLNGLPLSSVLLVTVFLASDGVALMPLIIVAVVVAFVVAAWIRPNIPEAAAAPTPPAPASAAAPSSA